jgi:predicted Kef-type K+ transport protein
LSVQGQGSIAVPHETVLISTIAVSLAYAFIAGVAAHYLRLPPLVG